MQRRSIFIFSAALSMTCLLSPAVAKDAYPDKPIRLVVPYTPGGGADSLARMVAQKMSEKLGQSIIIENKPGANTMLASSEVARSKADGYTLLYVASSFAINPSLYKVPYDTQKAFAPVGMVAEIPLIIIRNTKTPYTTVPALVAAAKNASSPISFASYGQGSPAHLGGELLQKMAGVTMLHVPYKGSAGAHNDLLGGQIPISFSSIEPALQIIRSKRAEPIAVMTKKRLSVLPNVPTVAETIPGFEAIGWNGIVAPAGTPEEVIARLNTTLNEAVMASDVQAKFQEIGVQADPMPAAQFGTLINSEITKWSDIVKSADIKL